MTWRLRAGWGKRSHTCLSCVCCCVCLCLGWWDDGEGGVGPASVWGRRNSEAVHSSSRTLTVDCVCCCLQPATSSSSSLLLRLPVSPSVTLGSQPCPSRWIVFAASQESSVYTRRLSAPPNSFEGFFFFHLQQSVHSQFLSKE